MARFTKPNIPAVLGLLGILTLSFQNCGHGFNSGSPDASASKPQSPPQVASSLSGTNFLSQGIMYKVSAPQSGPHQYQVQWNPENFYVNNSGKTMVVQSLDVTFRSLTGLRIAYFDFCVVIMKDGDVGTANGIEQLCFTEFKSDLASEFDHPTVHVDFPGQCLWFPSGTYFACGAQGFSDASQNPPNYAADLTCAAKLNYADITNPAPPVQALRTPYIDQRFTGNQSSLTPHTNLTSIARPVLGVWNYLGTFATNVTNCLGTELNSQSAWRQQCSNYIAQLTPNPEPLSMSFPQYAFQPGDQIAGECRIQSGDNSKGTICVSYFYVAVPVVNGTFVPLSRNATITTANAQSFCHSDPTQYALTNGADEPACLQTLSERVSE